MICLELRRETLPPRKAPSPLGAIALSLTAILLALCSTTVLLRDQLAPRRAPRAEPPGWMQLTDCHR